MPDKTEAILVVACWPISTRGYQQATGKIDKNEWAALQKNKALVIKKKNYSAIQALETPGPPGRFLFGDARADLIFRMAEAVAISCHRRSGCLA